MMSDPEKQIEKVSPVSELPIKEHLVERFLDNQTQELQLRTQELALQQQKDNNAFAYGKDALTAQLEDRKGQRVHESEARVVTFVFVGFVVFLIIGLIAYSIHAGKEAFATEIIKALVFLFSGGAGGYGFARSRPMKSHSEVKSKKDSE